MTDTAYTVLSERWDAQQSAYIASREARFDALMDILALSFSDPFTLVELGCGPGSLTRRLLTRFPHCRIIALDLDPLMLALASATTAPWAERVQVMQADLADPAWQMILEKHPAPDAVVSSTALHWLMPERQHTLHREIHSLLADNGVFLNADHQRFNSAASNRFRLSAGHDELTRQQAWYEGAPDWDNWFSQALALPELARLQPERDALFAGRPTPPPTTPVFQLASLTQAGFSESGPLWQLMDDYLIAGWK